VIDFGMMPIEQAALYEAPFAYVLQHVKPYRDKNRRKKRRDSWWQHGETAPAVRSGQSRIARFLCGAQTAKYVHFRWFASAVLPNSTTVLHLRDDDYFFGVLHSRIHEVWARAQGTQLREVESGFRYTPTTCFETFPLPWAPGQEPRGDPPVEAISEAARELNELRERWLNPPAEGGVGLGESELKKRTLTNLYNERPAWLEHAHRKLDAAVCAAYGWPDGMDDQEILARLLVLNGERAGAE
jgi:hypothetical protein